MDLWFVGRVPIGHYNYKLPNAIKIDSTSAPTGAKVYNGYHVECLTPFWNDIDFDFFFIFRFSS